MVKRTNLQYSPMFYSINPQNNILPSGNNKVLTDYWGFIKVLLQITADHIGQEFHCPLRY